MTRSSRRTLRRLIVSAGVALTAWLLADAGPALVERRAIESPDAIVMLSSHEWERLPATAARARENPSSLVILSIPRFATDLNCYRCAERPAWLREEGIDARRITVLPWTTVNTFDEARAVRRFVEIHPLRRVLVVTSPYHTRRALHTFETVLEGTGVIVGVEPASRTSEAKPNLWWWHKYDRHYVTYEWAAIVYYRVRHGVGVW
jgi:uncharacterized SAM-binding protein YcdF (DUF218 family)